MEIEAQVRHTVEIDRPPADVWTWLDDPEKQKQWMKDVVSNESTSDGECGVGSTFRMRIREGKRVGEYDGVITAWEPHTKMGIKMGCCGGGTIHVEYTLTDLGGRTRVDYECAAEMRGFWKLFGFVFRIFGRMMVKSFFKTLKELAEAEPAPESVAT